MSDNDHLFDDPAEYARLALDDLEANRYLHTDLTEPMLTAQRAGIAASLAIEARLGQIARALAASNLMAAFMSGVLTDLDDVREARRNIVAILLPDRDHSEGE